MQCLTLVNLLPLIRLIVICRARMYICMDVCICKLYVNIVRICMCFVGLNNYNRKLDHLKCSFNGFFFSISHAIIWICVRVCVYAYLCMCVCKLIKYAIFSLYKHLFYFDFSAFLCGFIICMLCIYISFHLRCLFSESLFFISVFCFFFFF